MCDPCSEEKAEISALKDSLAHYDSLDCKPKPKPRVKRERVYSPPPPVQREREVEARDFTPPGETERRFDANLEGKTYVGLQGEDYYMSISPDGYLMYAFHNKLHEAAQGNGKPELHYQGSGKYFVREGNYWVYVDRSQRVTDGLISGGPYRWSVYMGDAKGYPTYIPHEIIKVQIMEARGRLEDPITSADLEKIGARVDGVRAGSIRPNGVKKTNEGYPVNDEKIYEGWSFMTPIIYKTASAQ